MSSAQRLFVWEDLRERAVRAVEDALPPLIYRHAERSEAPDACLSIETFAGGVCISPSPARPSLLRGLAERLAFVHDVDLWDIHVVPTGDDHPQVEATRTRFRDGRSTVDVLNDRAEAMAWDFAEGEPVGDAEADELARALIESMPEAFEGDGFDELRLVPVVPRRLLSLVEALATGATHAWAVVDGQEVVRVVARGTTLTSVLEPDEADALRGWLAAVSSPDGVR